MQDTQQILVSKQLVPETQELPFRKQGHRKKFQCTTHRLTLFHPIWLEFRRTPARERCRLLSPQERYNSLARYAVLAQQPQLLPNWAADKTQIALALSIHKTGVNSIRWDLYLGRLFREENAGSGLRRGNNFLHKHSVKCRNQPLSHLRNPKSSDFVKQLNIYTVASSLNITLEGSRH